MSAIDHLEKTIKDLVDDIEVMERYRETIEKDIEEIDKRIDDDKKEIDDFKEAIDIILDSQIVKQTTNDELFDPFE